MRRFLHTLFALSLAVSCSTGETPEPAAVSQVPPSLRSDEEKTATIQISQLQSDELGLTYTLAMATDLEFDIIAPASAEALSENMAVVSTPIDGRIVRFHKSLGANVSRGEPLVSLQSLTYANMLGDYIKTKAEVSFQEAQYERYLTLNAQDITPASTLDRSRAEVQRARAEFMASSANLKALGMSQSEIEALSERSDTDPILVLRSPISGQVSSIETSISMAVNANMPLVHLMDASKVLVRCFINPKEAAYVKKGQSVELIRGGAISGITGAISEILPELDPESRSLVAIATVPASNQWPRPGERFQVRVKVASGDALLISLPETAVMVDGQDDVVFIDLGERIIEMRTVTILRREGGKVWIEQGIEDGERVLTSQLFTIKALFRVSQYSEE